MVDAPGSLAPLLVAERFLAIERKNDVKSEFYETRYAWAQGAQWSLHPCAVKTGVALGCRLLTRERRNPFEAAEESRQVSASTALTLDCCIEVDALLRRQEEKRFTYARVLLLKLSHVGL